MISKLLGLFKRDLESIATSSWKNGEIDDHTFTQMKTLSQAFQNISTGKGVKDTELYREYARLIGAEACPCTLCMRKQNEKNA